MDDSATVLRQDWSPPASVEFDAVAPPPGAARVFAPSKRPGSCRKRAFMDQLKDVYKQGRNQLKTLTNKQYAANLFGQSLEVTKLAPSLCFYPLQLACCPSLLLCNRSCP